MVDVAVRGGLKEYEMTNGKSWEEEMANDERLKASKIDDAAVKVEGGGEGNEDYESSVEMVKSCKRPWWVVQPYVRPLPIEALAKGSLTLSKKERMAKEAEEKSKKSSEVTGGHTKTEIIEAGTETVDVPKEGLVCG
jgi:tRNA-dihydrouridine synthase 1